MNALRIRDGYVHGGELVTADGRVITGEPADLLQVLGFMADAVQVEEDGRETVEIRELWPEVFGRG